MSSHITTPRGIVSRPLAAATLVVLACCGYAFVEAGRFLTHEDPLQKADAMLVLAGSRMSRPLEAADLYRDGWAPRIVMTRQTRDPAIEVLNRRGLAIPTDEELTKETLVRTGIPADALVLPERIHDNTAQEAQTLRQLAAINGWRRVIVVTSKFHLRRAGFAMRRELKGTNVEVVMRGSRYDPANPARWWMSRRDIREMLSEAPKLIAYALGLGA